MKFNKKVFEIMDSAENLDEAKETFSKVLVKAIHD
jgi:hypothetical protein